LTEINSRGGQRSYRIRRIGGAMPKVSGVTMVAVLEASAHDERVVGYTLRDSRYLNVTSRCTLRCAFCPKFNGSWEVRGIDLRLREDPSADALIAAAGDVHAWREIVFCGLGEPTLRLYTVLEVAARLRKLGAPRIRLNTDGLANLVYGRDVTPDFEGNLDALSISLNAQDEETYNRLCRPSLPGSYPAVLDFIRRSRDYVPEVVVTAVDGLPGVDIAACAEIAERLGVRFRRRVANVVG